MRKLIYLCVIVAVFAFQGCNNETKDTKETADSLNKTKDTTSNIKATGGIAVALPDAEFATKAAVGGMAEVALGKLAIEKTLNAKIREFANMMVNDHGKANEELTSIAKMKNVTLPAAMDDEHLKKMEELKKKTGTDFDKAYVEAMMDGHKKTLKLMQNESKDGKDADLKAFAGKTVLIVETHLDLINKIHDSIK